MNLSYNNDFIPQYNIFNINTSSVKGNIGINNFFPKSLIDINGPISIKNNLIISNSIYYNNNLSNIQNNNDVYILNKLNNKINIFKLILVKQNITNKWIIENNKLTLKLDGMNHNTIIQYKSDIYSIYNSNNNIKLLINKNIIITHILLFNDNNNDNNNLTKIIKLNQNNNIENTITKLNTFSNNIILYKINSLLLLSEYLNILNIPNIKNCKIQFLGKYTEDTNSQWLSNNNNTYINKTVSVFSNNNYNYELYINGNVLFNKNIKTKYLNSSNLNVSKNINISNILNTSYIETYNNLNFNSIKLNIGNNNNKNNHNIGKTNISNTGIFNIDNLILKNNLNINYNIIHNLSNSILSFKNDNINLSYILLSKNEQINNITNIPSHHTSIFDISNNKINVNCKTFLTNKKFPNINNFKNTYNLSVFYNTTITNNINSKNITYKGKLNDLRNKSSINIYNNINVNSLTANYININNLQTKHIIFNYNNNINYNIIGSIHINSTNKLLGNNNNNYEFILSNINKSSNTTKSIIDSINVNTIKLPLISNTYNNYIYNYDTIGLLKFNKTHFQLNDGNNWHNLNFDNLDNKIVKITQKYNPIFENTYNTIIPPNKYYNVVFINPPNNTKLLLTETNNINNKAFKIKFNKIYTNDNNRIQFTLYNIKKINNKFEADIISDLRNNNILAHIELHNIIETIPYILIKLNGFANKYKIQIAPKDISNDNKIYIKQFRIYNYNNNETPLYVININYNNTTNIYTCNLFQIYNYQITVLEEQTLLCKIEYSHTTNNNTFYIINNHIATSINNKTSLILQNLVFDEDKKYYTANIITSYQNNFLNDFYYIKGNRIVNLIDYTIKEKKHLYNNIYQAIIVKDSYNF